MQHGIGFYTNARLKCGPIGAGLQEAVNDVFQGAKVFLAQIPVLAHRGFNGRVRPGDVGGHLVQPSSHGKQSTRTHVNIHKN